MMIARVLACACAGIVAAFGIAVPVVEAADISEPPPSWTGPYGGVNIGYGWDSGDVDLSNRTTDPLLDEVLQALNAAGSFPTSLSPDAQGILGGGQVGYNWQPSSEFVVGIEADLQASDIAGSDKARRAPLFFDETETEAGKKVDWFGTLRARAGYLVAPQWLLYATGGLAYGKTGLNFKETNITQGCFPNATICGDDTSSGVKLGWAAGAGAEVMLSPSWSIKAEYLYVDLGKRSFEADTNTPIVFKASADFREQIARVGLNYHFD